MRRDHRQNINLINSGDCLMDNFKGPVLVTGSRSLTNYETFCKLFRQTGWTPSFIIHGGASGVDSLAARYCRENNIEERIMKANWENFGNAAGPIRNQQMVDLIKEEGGKVFGWHDGSSRGTKQCIEYAESKGVEVYLCVSKQKEAYTIQTLEELDKKIKDSKLIGADIARNLIKQLIDTKKEYLRVAKDCSTLWKACKSMGSYERNGESVYVIDEMLVTEALNTPTAKYLEEQSAKS